jgi:hypothetical protein
LDINNNGRWDQGEAVVYDSNNNNLYDGGENVIAGFPILNQAALTIDGHIKFIGAGLTWDRTAGNPVVYDANNDNKYTVFTDPHLRFVDSNANNRWDPGEAVIYDKFLNGIYNSSDTVLYGTAPPTGTAMKLDALIKFVDINANGVWDTGEAIVYDTNANGIYDFAEPLIVPANPIALSPLSVDARIKFVGAGTTWNKTANNPVVFDTIGRGFYNATVDPKIKFWDLPGTGIYQAGDSVVYDTNNNGIFDTGDILIAGPMPILGESPLTIEPHFHFIDAALTGRWLRGETIVFDTNLNHIYDAGEPVIVGTAPANLTSLKEPVIAGPTPAVGTPLKPDSRLKYVDLDKNNVWQYGEAVVYDTNLNGLYDPGEPIIVGSTPTPATLLQEPVIAGAQPASATILKTDTKLRFIDTNRNGIWDTGEPVVYDNNSNGVYDPGEPIVASAALGDGVWNPGETVVYDTNANSIFNTGEPVAFGTAPLNGTFVKYDVRIKFVDANRNGVWDPGETVIFDPDNNNVFDSADIVIVGTAPATSLFSWPSVTQDLLGRIWLTWNEKPAGTTLPPIVYFKIWNGTAWSDKQAVTTGTAGDGQNFVLPLANQTMMILWSSNSTGHPQLFYRLYSVGTGNPTPTIGPVQLTSTPLLDLYPSAVQDRQGRIWVAWARSNTAATISQIYYKYYNGTAWSSDFQVPPASVTNLLQHNPSISQTKDGTIRLFWASNDTKRLGIFYTTTNGALPTLPSTGIPASAWTAKTAVPYNASTKDNDRPSLIQARDGTYWLFFQGATDNGVSSTQFIYYATSADGVTWPASAIQLTSAEDFTPAAAQITMDHRIWVFYATVSVVSTQIWLTKSDPITGRPDVGLSSLNVSPTFIQGGFATNITMLISNYGDNTVTTTLTIMGNSTIIQTTTLTLTSGQNIFYLFTWSNAGPWGRYTLTATSSAPGISGDNTISGATLKISPPGDANGDGRVNILDLAIIAFCFSKPAVPGTACGPNVDTNHDGVINILDLAIAAFYFGKGF